ncbi:MAG: CAP domain-containing protein [Candidatus Korobacteraceae bacterium]
MQWINQERASQGVPPLAVDQRLTEAARKHTSLMVEHQALSHQFDGEATMEIRFADENLRSDQQAENVDVSKDVPSAHRGFMHSPPHRANILNPNYNVVGVAVIRSGDRVYVTEDFAHRVTASSEPEADAALHRAIETYATAHGMSPPVRKPQAQLRHMACDMALNDSLQSQKAVDLPGVQEVAAWTAAVPSDLPGSAKELLSHPMPSGYSLGACFAPSVSQPGGIYWVVMIVY